MEIHKRTKNRYGLRHALKAIRDAGGTIEASWKLRQAFAVGDEAVGVPVLTELYDAWRHSAVDVDLSALWDDLGVVVSRGGDVSFDDSAPLAAARRAMTGWKPGAP